MCSDVLTDESKQLCNGVGIKSIVFDLGGVLFTEGKSVAMEKLFRDYGYDPDVIWDLLNCKRSRDLRKGLVSEEEFWSWAEDQLPPEYSARVIRDAWYGGYVPDRAVFELVKRLKGRYRLVAFSENIRDRVEYLERKHRFRELFDVEIYSYDHQAGKRDPRFLDVLLKTLGEQPGEILYIDNFKGVLDRAEQRGINVVLYTTGKKARIETAMRRLGIDV